jgi:hypothetical protein
MNDRVDKGWVEKGLENYSLAAICNSLKHYGVDVDEPKFRALAAEDFPLAIAGTWHESWKGKGQFSRFPAAAAEELWRRLMAPAIAPTDVTLALIKLIDALEGMLEGEADDGTWNTRFAVVEAYLPRLPEDLEKRMRFADEIALTLGEYLEVFDTMAVHLAEEGKPEFADRFVAIEESIFPLRRGATSAMVKAAKGDLDGGLADLRALAEDATRDDFARLSAVDGLMDFEAFDDAKRVLLSMLEKAEKARDLELASHVVEMLTELLKADPQMKDKNDIRARVEGLAAALGEPSAE